MKFMRLVFGILFILVLIYNADAGEKQFSVLVNVPIKNELTDRVKSFVTRELRGFSDIKLVDQLEHKNRQYFISIVPVQIKLTNGVIVGVAVSYVFQDGERIMHHVLTGSPEALKTLCQELVSAFDTTIIEPNRKK